MKIPIYLLTLLLFSCNNATQNELTNSKEIKQSTIAEVKGAKNQISDSLYLITRCDTIPLDLMEISRKRKSLLTFQKQTYIYCSPSTKSKIIDTLFFNSEIVSWKPIIRKYEPEQIERDGKMVTINRAKENWCETIFNGNKGYLLENGLTLKILRNNILFGENLANERQSNARRTYQILSFDKEDKNKVIDSMVLNRNHGYEIESLVYNGLDLCDGVIKYREFRQSCPGGGSTNFISINKKGQLKEIISSFYGTLGNSTIYFPLKFKSGKVLLVADGDVNEIFDRYNGVLKIYDYPKDLGIPIEQLIVETKVVYTEDIEGLSEDEIEIQSSETNFYKWNGSKLIKIKTTGNNV